MTKTGLFTGTFDPFTIGHQNIVDRALPLFDRLIIAVAESELKHTSRTIEQRVEAIQQLYAHDERVKVIAYSDLTIDLAKRENIGFIVRGVRSVKDYEYEIAQADFNRQFGNVETIFLPADPNLAMISSSLVRELEHFGKDVTRFLPHEKKVDETGNFRK
jgi:pantetheine-phosphate adenylyltransferase